MHARGQTVRLGRNRAFDGQDCPRRRNGQRRRDPAIEGDVRDIFFASMAVDATRHVIVTTEVGQRFAVDVGTLIATPFALQTRFPAAHYPARIGM